MRNSRLKTLGYNIKIIRIKEDVSQEKLAELVGVSNDTISNIENGNHKTSVLTIIDIARALNVDINEFIKDV